MSTILVNSGTVSLADAALPTVIASYLAMYAAATIAVPKDAIARPSASAKAVRSSRILFEGRGISVSDYLENNPGDDRLFRWPDYCGRLIRSGVGTLLYLPNCGRREDYG